MSCGYVWSIEITGSASNSATDPMEPLPMAIFTILTGGLSIPKYFFRIYGWIVIRCVSFANCKELIGTHDVSARVTLSGQVQGSCRETWKHFDEVGEEVDLRVIAR